MSEHDDLDDDDGAWGGETPERPRPLREPPLDAFAARVADLLEASGKTQREIARDLGYRHPNILSMFKTGVTRVPIDKVAPLAFALGADERELVRLWVSTYMPEVKAMLERSIGAELSPAERGWIDALRLAFSDRVPPLDRDAETMLRVLASRRNMNTPEPGPGSG
jgi:transcriptional regulator with XRE-family HTH domain